MPAAKGNQNAKGNKGGTGRPSAYKEKENAEKLLKAFFSDNDQEKLEAKIRTGKYSIFDRLVLTAMEGDTRILSNLSNKVFPEILSLPDGTNIIPVVTVIRSE